MTNLDLLPRRGEGGSAIRSALLSWAEMGLIRILLGVQYLLTSHVLVPHILDSVREGLILYGRRSSWDDPLQVMMDSWPWSIPPTGLEVRQNYELYLLIF